MRAICPRTTTGSARILHLPHPYFELCFPLVPWPRERDILRTRDADAIAHSHACAGHPSSSSAQATDASSLSDLLYSTPPSSATFGHGRASCARGGRRRATAHANPLGSNFQRPGPLDRSYLYSHVCAA